LNPYLHRKSKRDWLMTVICDRYCRYSNGDARTQEELDRECERCTIHKALIGGEEINFVTYKENQMNEQNVVKGFKVFNPNWTCRGFHLAGIPNPLGVLHTHRPCLLQIRKMENRPEEDMINAGLYVFFSPS